MTRSSKPNVSGEFDTCLAVEFFRALAFNMGATLHLKLEYSKTTTTPSKRCSKAPRAISAAAKKPELTRRCRRKERFDMSLMGTQFHPEKSGECGMKILKIFCSMV